MRIFSISGRVAHEAIPRKIEWKLRRETARGNREIPGRRGTWTVERPEGGRYRQSLTRRIKRYHVPEASNRTRV